MLPTPSTDTPPAAALPDFDKLVANLLERPELASDPSAVSDEVLAELLKRLNPYSACVPNPPTPSFKQVVACSYTNLRDDYLRRFVVTAATSFLFQVAGEWEPPATSRRWTPATRAAKDAAATEPFAASALLDRARAVAAVAEEASSAAEDATAAREEARAATAAALVAEEAAAQSKAKGETGSDADALTAAAASAAAAAKTAAATAGDAAARAAGLLYAATHLLAGAGGEADRRMHATAAAGMQYAAVREVLTQFPLPPPPAQVEVPVEIARGLVVDFLTRWLDFDASKHVRAGRDRPAAAGTSAWRNGGSAEVSS